MVDFAADKKASGGFESVVGQDDLKTGLLAVAAADGLDGLLIRGEKGTAKSTTVRALADLLPTQRVVTDCPYGCPPDEPHRQCEDCRGRDDPPVDERPTPLVTLPLGATRDRVVGTLSVADALAGEAEFDPGLLAQANRGLLYVDEVNLLDDHLVDVLLDAAAGGVNRVERDGVTVSHPAEFTLVGTMNPEEGDLRPQLRDRFALQTEVRGCRAVDDRVAIIDRALDATAGRGDIDSPDRSAGERLATARDLLPGVTLAREFREQIAQLCLDAGVEGHRADIATARAARTLAALDGRTTVLESDIERAAGFALPHRLQSRPFEDSPALDDVLDDHFEDEGDEPGGERDGDGGTETGDATDENTAATDTGPSPESGDADRAPDDDIPEPSTAGDGSPSGDGDHAPGGGAPEPSTAGDGSPPEDGDDCGASESDPDDESPLLPGQSRPGVGESGAPAFETPTVDAGTASGGADATGTERGATVRTEPADGGDVDAAASVRAAARNGHRSVGARDLRRSVRAGEAGTLVVFAVDASASMRPAMRAAKGCVLELLRDAYEARDQVAVVTFAGESAEVVLPPTDSVSLAARHLKDLPTGDRTPLPAGLTTTADVLERANPDAGIAIVVTDGRANAGGQSPVAATREGARRLGSVADRTVVVDAGDDSRAGLTGTVADATDAEVVALSSLTAERVDAAAGQ